VKPYLSRLLPAEPGPRLHPRPRSRFEPAPTLPIDGPVIASLGLSFPPTWDAEPAGAEIEVERDTPDPSPPRLAVAAATPGEQGPPPVPTTAPEPDPQDEERAPTHAARADRSAPRTRPPTTAPAGNSRRQAPESNDVDFPTSPGERAGPPDHAPAAPSPARRSVPPTQRTLPDQPPVFGGLASPGAEPAPPEPAPAQHPRPTPQQGLSPMPPPGAPAPPRQSPTPTPHRHPDLTSQEAQARQMAPRPPDDVEVPAAHGLHPPSDAPDDHVNTMARRLREANAAFAGIEATAKRSTGPQLAPPPVRVPTQSAGDTKVTVTIGRIEVKAPAADPTPARSPSRGPRRQAPTLADYLASRTRATGRPR
jgi:hypothetical protein